MSLVHHGLRLHPKVKLTPLKQWHFIPAKFAGKCAETGKPFAKGECIVFESTQKKAYASGSENYSHGVEMARDKRSKRR